MHGADTGAGQSVYRVETAAAGSLRQTQGACQGQDTQNVTAIEMPAICLQFRMGPSQTIGAGVKRSAVDDCKIAGKVLLGEQRHIKRAPSGTPVRSLKCRALVKRAGQQAMRQRAIAHEANGLLVKFEAASNPHNLKLLEPT